ncbi:MAG: hypothetical protein FAF03_08435 [Epsilonproteobacteria bacterium]|nr:hypothetical protein [Campylobacterota bacterium]
MMKIIVSSAVLSAMLLLSGCGETTDEISSKDKVVILHDVGVSGCLLLENFGKSKLEEQDTVKNTAYTSKDNDVSCDTYGKVRGDITSYDSIDAGLVVECAEITLAQIQEAIPQEDLSIYENKDKSCVLSFDLI